MRKHICVILTLIFIFVGAFGGYQIYREYLESQESADSYTDLKEHVFFPEFPPSEDCEETNSSESGEIETEPVGPTVDFDALLGINEDCVGWIYIDGTAINYPVVQSSDNRYYLKHLFDGRWNNSGCIFLDSRVAADLSNRHSII